MSDRVGPRESTFLHRRVASPGADFEGLMRWLNDYDPQPRPADAAERRALRSLVSLAASGRSVAVTRRMRVVLVGVVLAQQILAVVVAIGGATTVWIWSREGVSLSYMMPDWWSNSTRITGLRMR